MFFLIGISASAQVPVNPDSLDTKRNQTVQRTLEASPEYEEIESKLPDHDPIKAALYGAALPGLGQVYNKKYWKIPIVWGGLATFGYFIDWTNDNYQYYQMNLRYEVAKNPEFPNTTGLDQATLRRARDYYRRQRDQLTVYGILFYFIQIVDAHVDAHLIEFDVNQDLSVKVDPTAIPVNGISGAGLSLKIRF